jgi:hypothetical protein
MELHSAKLLTEKSVKFKENKTKQRVSINDGDSRIMELLKED